MQPIFTKTLTNAVYTFTFNNIPQNYTDLYLEISGRTDYASASWDSGGAIFFNGDNAGTTYSSTLLTNNGATTTSSRYANNPYTYYGNIPTTSITNTFGNIGIYIPNYSGASFKQTLISVNNENNATTSYQYQESGVWRSTAPITSISLYGGAGNWAAGSTFTLYGTLRPGNYPKAIGGQISTDGTYWYHAFRNIGTDYFNPIQNLSADILCVAGGGGSGGSGIAGGAGGAGGVLYNSSQALTPFGQYPVLVGAGGGVLTNGGNSQFSTLNPALGGGYGGGNNANGNSGGSGGGAGEQGASQTPIGGSGTPGQGNSGGNNPGAGCSPTGGGGGAGAAGSNGVSGTPGVGGVGTSSYSSWGLATGTGQNVSGTVYFAGGGGGGSYCTGSASGGYGGGGAGVVSNSNTYSNNGTPNTGGGAGGGGIASGGSGVVIVRYSV